jgi:hypothetical protein
MENRRFGVFSTVAEAIHQQPATDRAVRTGITGFTGAQQFILPRFRQRYAGRKAQCRCRGACHTASADLKELPSADLHGSLLVSTLLTYVVLTSRLRIDRKGEKFALIPQFHEGYHQNTTMSVQLF